VFGVDDDKWGSVMIKHVVKALERGREREKGVYVGTF
jgi:hypothetical protein